MTLSHEPIAKRNGQLAAAGVSNGDAGVIGFKRRVVRTGGTTAGVDSSAPSCQSNPLGSGRSDTAPTQ